MSREIFITKSDKVKLQKLIAVEQEFNVGKKEYLEKLAGELERASVVLPEAVPNDVITMNSTVQLRDVDSEEEMTLTLVYPGEADMSQNKISILAPVGTALIGYKAGDSITWEVPGGRVLLQVEKILYQPEAVGNFDL